MCVRQCTDTEFTALCAIWCSLIWRCQHLLPYSLRLSAACICSLQNAATEDTALGCQCAYDCILHEHFSLARRYCVCVRVPLEDVRVILFSHNMPVVLRLSLLLISSHADYDFENSTIVQSHGINYLQFHSFLKKTSFFGLHISTREPVIRFSCVMCCRSVAHSHRATPRKRRAKSESKNWTVNICRHFSYRSFYFRHNRERIHKPWVSAKKLIFYRFNSIKNYRILVQTSDKHCY